MCRIISKLSNKMKEFSPHFLPGFAEGLSQELCNTFGNCWDISCGALSDNGHNAFGGADTLLEVVHEFGTKSELHILGCTAAFGEFQPLFLMSCPGTYVR